jgi:ribosomal protein S18 acetylase RimI-like enzyme
MNSLREVLRPVRQDSKLVSVIRADLKSDEHARWVLGLLDEFAEDPMGIGRPLTASVRRNLIRGMRTTRWSLVLLALLEGKPVGIAVCMRGFSTFQARPTVNIHDLFVRERHRGCGIGWTLLRAVEKRALRIGACKITLEVREDNKTALGLYKQAGFEGTEGTEGAEDNRRTFFLERPLKRRRRTPKVLALPAPSEREQD